MAYFLWIKKMEGPILIMQVQRPLQSGRTWAQRHLRLLFWFMYVQQQSAHKSVISDQRDQLINKYTPNQS